MVIGVLALQGSFKEHIEMLHKCGAETKEVRLPKDLIEVEALIIPGGESTTLLKLLKLYRLDQAIKKLHANGMPIYGTCAGAILLAKNVENPRQDSLGLMDITVQRNSYGRQLESFSTMINAEGIGELPGVFIRSPVIKANNSQVNILATHEDSAVLAEQGNLLVSTFHPELTDDTRIHEYFLKKVENIQK